MNDTHDSYITSGNRGSEPNTHPEPTSLSDRVRSLRLADRPVRAGSRRVWLPWTLCGLLVLVAAGLGSLALQLTSAMQEFKNKLQTQTGPDGTTSSTGFTTASIASSGEVVLESKGNIVPVHQIQVSPKVSGMVLELDILEGKWVPKGYVLARLEDVNYLADYEHARAALAEAQQNLEELTKFRQKEIEQAKARWEEADVQSKQLAIDLRRSSRLRRTSSLADRDYEQAESAYRAMVEHAKALRFDYELLVKGPRDKRIEAAEAKIRQAEADVAKNKWMLDNCVVTAPIAGTILKKNAEMGNIVNPIAFNISASLCDMADLLDLEVDLNIQERDIAKVFKGQRCQIRPDAYPDHVYEGYVSRLMPMADRAKGAVPVRVKVIIPEKEKTTQQKGEYLRPEMGAVVSFYKKK